MDNEFTSMDDFDLTELSLQNERLNANEEISRPDSLNGDSISMRVGDSNSIDVHQDSHYLNMTKPEREAVASLGTELFGSQFEIDSKVAAEGGRTPGMAVVETAKEYIAKGEGTEVQYETVADAVRDMIESKVEAEGGSEQEKIEALKSYIESGTESFKEKVLELAEGESANDISSDKLSSMLDDFKEAVSALEEKEAYAQERSSSMTDKLENYAKFDDLSPRNTFKAFSGLAIKIQAYQDKIPINGKVPSAASIILDASYALKTNIFESILEVAITSIEHAIEKREEDIEKSEKDTSDRVEADQNADNDTVSSDNDPEKKMEISTSGFTDNGTVVREIGKEERNQYLERNPAIGSVGGVSLRYSNIDRLSYTDKSGTERTNPLSYNVQGIDKGVIGAKILSSTSVDAKYAVAADRTVIAAWGVDADNSKVGGSIDNVEGYKNAFLRMDANGVDYNARNHDGMSVSDYGKTSLIDTYEKFSSTYIDVANKEKSEIEKDSADIRQDRDDLQEKYDALSDEDKESKFGADVKERISHLDSCLEKYDARTAQIDKYIDNVSEFKEAYKDYCEGKATLDDVLQKEVKAENSAVSRSMECTCNKANGVTWKDGYQVNGVEVIDRDDRAKANDSHDLVENFDDRKEAFEAENKDIDGESANNDVENTENDNVADDGEKTETDTNDDTERSEEEQNAADQSEDESDDTERSEEEQDAADQSEDESDDTERSEEEQDAADQSEDESDDTERFEEEQDATDQSENEPDEAERSEEEQDAADQSEDESDDTERSEEEQDAADQSEDDPDDTEQSEEEQDATDQSEDAPDDTEQSEEEQDATDQSGEDSDDTERSEEEQDAADQSEEDSDDTERSEEEQDAADQSGEDSDDTERSEEEQDAADQSGEDSDDTERSEEEQDAADLSEDESDIDQPVSDSFEGEESDFDAEDVLAAKEDLPEFDIGTSGEEVPENPELERALAEASAANVEEFSFDDDYTSAADVDEPVQEERAASIAFEKHEDSSEQVNTSDFSSGIERMNEHMDEYSFADFIDDYKEMLAEDGADQKLVEAYADYVSQDGVDVNPDLTYSLAFYDESGFCVGMERIEHALEERGMSEERIESISEEATDKFCSDNVIDIDFKGEIIEISVPITRDQQFVVFDVDYKINAGDEVTFVIDLGNDYITGNFFDERGNFFSESIDGEHEKGHFACDILGNVFGLEVGDMLNDIYDKLVELPGQEDLGADIAIDKIYNHIGEIIEMRGLGDIEKEEAINIFVDELANEIDAEYNDSVEVETDDMEVESQFENDFDNDEEDLP